MWALNGASRANACSLVPKNRRTHNASPRNGKYQAGAAALYALNRQKKSNAAPQLAIAKN
jgi:hypothetical protein